MKKIIVKCKFCGKEVVGFSITKSICFECKRKRKLAQTNAKNRLNKGRKIIK